MTSQKDERVESNLQQEHGQYTIPAKNGVTYYVGGKALKKGTYSGKNKYVTVTAKAKSGYVLSGSKTWKYEFRPSFKGALVDYLVYFTPSDAGAEMLFSQTGP